MNIKKVFRIPGAGFLILTMLVTLLVPSAAALQDGDGEQLEMYTVVAEPGQVDDLVREGFDVVAIRTVSEQVTEVDVVLTGRQRAALQARGLQVNVKRNK